MLTSHVSYFISPLFTTNWHQSSSDRKVDLRTGVPNPKVPFCRKDVRLGGVSSLKFEAGVFTSSSCILAPGDLGGAEGYVEERKGDVGR